MNVTMSKDILFKLIIFLSFQRIKFHGSVLQICFGFPLYTSPHSALFLTPSHSHFLENIGYFLYSWPT